MYKTNKKDSYRDKCKIISAYNTWVTAINLENLSVYSKKVIANYNSNSKKLFFESVLKLFTYGINEEKESLRDLSMYLINKSLQTEINVTTINCTRLSQAFDAF